MGKLKSQMSKLKKKLEKASKRKTTKSQDFVDSLNLAILKDQCEKNKNII